MSSPVLAARGRLNALQRHRPADDPELQDARLHLRAESLAEHIARAVAEAPPLTPEQTDRLSALLRGGAA